MIDFENPHHLLAAAQKVRAKFLERYTTTSISAQQAASNRDDPVKGPVWVSKFTVPKPTNDNSRDLFLGLVDEANYKNVRYDRPDSAMLHFEWTGFRSDASEDTPEPSLPETEKFQNLMAETTSPLTILYIHGGSFRVNTPSCYRKRVGSLAQFTGSKVLMVRMRWAPQDPFPAALLDVFQAYLTLLAPPPGSPHEAIFPSSIVVAGDSSGACFALGLLQVLLRLNRRNESIIFHGQTIKPAIPSGITLLSPLTELTNAFPSYEKNVDIDIFPVPSTKPPYLERDFPTCSVWPTSPARADIYCEAEMMMHPLASPLVAEDWSGSCPLWFASGQEQVGDPSRLLAQTAHAQGVSVTLYEYEKMPHTFFWLFAQAPQTRKFFDDWAKAIISFSRGETPPSSAWFIYARGLTAKPMDIKQLVPYTMAEARKLMWKNVLCYKVPPFHQIKQSTL